MAFIDFSGSNDIAVVGQSAGFSFERRIIGNWGVIRSSVLLIRLATDGLLAAFAKRRPTARKRCTGFVADGIGAASV